MKKPFLPIPTMCVHAKNQASMWNGKGASPWTDKQTNKQTNKQTDRQTYPERTKDWRPMNFFFNFYFYFFIGGLINLQIYASPCLSLPSAFCLDRGHRLKDHSPPPSFRMLDQRCLVPWSIPTKHKNNTKIWRFSISIFPPFFFFPPTQIPQNWFKN